MNRDICSQVKITAYKCCYEVEIYTFLHISEFEIIFLIQITKLLQTTYQLEVWGVHAQSHKLTNTVFLIGIGAASS